MTPIDCKALAERLKEHAALHDSLAAHSDEQRQWADDLRTVATMLEGMADAKPVGMFIKFGKPGDERYDLASRKYWGDPDLVPLYLHPAPQPQPAQPPKCGCRSCLTPAELLSTFVVCPKCGNKRCPKADDHRNACTDSNAPGQAPQPERQPVSEPIEAQCMGCGKSYSDFALDLTLPADQWRAIHPEGDGLLCANCIVARAAKVPGAVAVRAQIDTGEQREPTEAKPNQNTGHGHVRPRPDGVKARCGGPAICPECAREQAQLLAAPQRTKRGTRDVSDGMRAVEWIREYRIRTGAKLVEAKRAWDDGLSMPTQPQPTEVTLKLRLHFYDEDGPLEIVAHGSKRDMAFLETRIGYWQRLDDQFGKKQPTEAQPFDAHMEAADARYPDEPTEADEDAAWCDAATADSFREIDREEAQRELTERSTVSDLERICAESYQVVGWLADECGLFDNESVIKALDNLSEQRLVHEDVLPFAPVERRRREQEGAAEMTEAEKRIRTALSVASIEPRDDRFKVDTDDLTALLADQAALRAEVERLKAAIDMQPSPPTREDMEWAGKVHLAEAEKENDALRAEVETLRAERDQLAEFVIAVGGFWGHSKSKLVGESSLAEVINRSIEDEDALRKDAECFRLLKARMGAAIDAALAQAKEKPDA